MNARYRVVLLSVLSLLAGTTVATLAAAEIPDAAAILKVGRHLPRLRSIIDECGLTAHAHYVEYASRAEERVMALRERGNEPAPYFSMLLISRGPT